MFVETAPVDVAVSDEMSFAALSATLRRLSEECRTEIRAAIPADKIEAYTKIRERAKLRFTELTNVQQHSTEGLNQTARMRQQILRETKDALGQLGLDGRTIEQIQKKYSAQAQSAVEDAFDASEKAPYVDAGRPPISADLRGWQRIVPPYTNQRGGTLSYGPAVHRAWHWEDRSIGAIGCYTSNLQNHAGDNDSNLAWAESEVQFQFRMPAAGAIEVWASLEPVGVNYGGYLWDEWGFSDAYVRQHCRLYLDDPASPWRRYVNLINLEKRRNDEGQWSHAVGYPIAARLFSQREYAANELVTCAVGFESYDYSWLDTMSCYTHMENRWIVTEISVQSTGSIRNG